MSNQKYYYEYNLASKKKGTTVRLGDDNVMRDFAYKTMTRDGCQLDTREYFYAFYLDAHNNLKGYQLVSIGGVSSVLVDPKIVYSAALMCLASSVVFVHNHPSGNPIPSTDDDMLTKRLVAGAKLLHMAVTDHVILTPDNNRFYSYRANAKLID